MTAIRCLLLAYDAMFIRPLEPDSGLKNATVFYHYPTDG